FCFQAEDGIRDFHVTGVQTCALPIYDDRGEPRGQLGNAGQDVLRSFHAAPGRDMTADRAPAPCPGGWWVRSGAAGYPGFSRSVASLAIFQNRAGFPDARADSIAPCTVAMNRAASDAALPDRRRLPLAAPALSVATSQASSCSKCAWTSAATSSGMAGSAAASS